MLEGRRVGLRDLRREDHEVLHAAFSGDAAIQAMVTDRPWRPVSLEQHLARIDKRDTEPADDTKVAFAIQRLDTSAGRCIGDALLWDINQHERTAHVGIGLVPEARGQGFGRDAVDLLCEYAFIVRDLHRLQLETLAINTAMQSAAKACGFIEEGRNREAGWVMGERCDLLTFGILAREWRASHAARSV